MSDFNQIPTKVKFRMIQLKVRQTVSGRCFGPVLTVPFYAVKRNEPRRLTGINLRGLLASRYICINQTVFGRCLSYVLTVLDYLRLTRMTRVEPE